MGWVGQGCSPGTSVSVGTGTSRTSNSGLPVTRSRMNMIAVLFIATSAGVTRPPRLMSTSVSVGRTRSQMSWCTVWKCQRYLPVAASTATTELEYRLAPLRSAPHLSKVGAPTFDRRSEEHTSELQPLTSNYDAMLCFKQQKTHN